MAVLSFVIAFDKAGNYLPLIAAVMAHEIGHLICIIAMRGKIHGIRIVPGGLDISYTGADTYLSDVMIAAAGPCANYIAALITSVFSGGNAEYFIGLNLMLCFFNLIPTYPLDGGKIICSAMEWLSPVNGQKMFSMFSASVSLMLFAISLGACFYNAKSVWTAMVFAVILVNQRWGYVYKESI